MQSPWGWEERESIAQIFRGEVISMHFELLGDPDKIMRDPGRRSWP